MAKEKFDFIQPFKDIPRALKGFPKNIIGSLKEPVKNNAQVKERRRDLYPFMYLLGILLVVLLVLSVILSDLQMIFTTVAMVPGLLLAGCFFLLLVLKKAEEKFTDLECPNCKAQIKHSSDVQIKVLKKDFIVTGKKDYMSSVNRNNLDPLGRDPMYCELKGKETTTVEITCKCQECGTEKTFTHAFVTVECVNFANNIMAKDMGVKYAEMEKAIREEGAEGFDGKSGTTDRGVEIKYNRSISMLVFGYFGNEIQIR